MLEHSRHTSLDAVGQRANGSFACLTLYVLAGAVLAVAALMGLRNGDMQLLPHALTAAALWLGFGGWLLYRSLRPSRVYAQAYHMDAPDYRRMPTPESSTTAQTPWELYAFWGIPSARTLHPTRASASVRSDKPCQCRDHGLCRAGAGCTQTPASHIAIWRLPVSRNNHQKKSCQRPCSKRWQLFFLTAYQAAV